MSIVQNFNKKYTQSLFLCFFLISSYVFAQKPVLLDDFTFKIGEKYKRIKSLNTYYVASGDRFLSVKKGRNSMTVQRYALKDLKENVKLRQVIEDKGDFQTVMKLGNKAVVFYTIRDKAFAQKLSLTGIVAEKPIQLAFDKENIDNDFSFKSTYGFDAGGRINKFAFKKSPDGTKLLVLYRIQTAQDKADKIGILVYDTSLKLIWRRKVTLPYTTNKIENEDFTIDNAGDFYMTASVFNGDSSDKDKIKSSYRTEVFKIKENPKEIIKSKIDISGKSITNAIINVTSSGVIKISGFYSNNDNKEETSGVFSASLDETGVVNNTVKSDFPSDVMEQYVLKREERVNEGTQREDDKKDLEDLKVNNVVFNGDGSSVIFGEQRYAESFTTSSSSGSRTTYKYYYRDIFAIKLSTQGNVDWMHKLPKFQMGTQGKRSMSYFNFRNQGKHYLFYIDDFTNLKRTLDEFPTRYFDGKKEFIYLTSYVINDATGEVTKEPILTGSDIRNARLDVMELSKYGTLPNKDMIFEAYDGKKNNLLLKISLAK
ncbi:hypothetical protein [Aquimarina sp. 2201CG5-10]|uniref:hypothetical protein n=1 Tax=Aquimarina callyspongiae TaxID=3098150 RepID=UPI002AB5BB32|nr:hypothetical protein [Aquimarina sp. 2201CG5-10]MDY8138420.1 hypothetical protein [Aquimarina sp. 2201CG5-10]